MTATVAFTAWHTIELGDLVQNNAGTLGIVSEMETIRGFNTLRVKWPDSSETWYPFANECNLIYIGRQ